MVLLDLRQYFALHELVHRVLSVLQRSTLIEVYDWRHRIRPESTNGVSFTRYGYTGWRGAAFRGTDRVLLRLFSLCSVRYKHPQTSVKAVLKSQRSDISTHIEEELNLRL